MPVYRFYQDPRMLSFAFKICFADSLYKNKQTLIKVLDFFLNVRVIISNKTYSGHGLRTVHPVVDVRCLQTAYSNIKL